MVSKQQVQILIEAQENVSKVAKKAEDALSKLGSVGSNALNRITNIGNKVQNALSKISSYVDRAREKFNAFKNSSDKIGMIKNAISNAANSFGQLINSSNLAASAMEKIKSVSDGIQAKFTSLQNKITSFGSSVKSSLTSAFSLTGIKEKLSSLGSSIDNLKIKLKELQSQAGSTGGGFGFLKNAVSMTAGMIGYDLFNSFMQAGRAAINAQGQLQYFGQRLNLSSQETAKFNTYLGNMQKEFRKVNMKAVGASAEEMAVKLKLPKTSIEELTKVTAVLSSAFVKEGRTQEDAILAVSDALDGEFKRLKELGITQDMLKNNGWNGDLNDKNSLLKAMNKTLDDMGFTQTAKDITSLDEAFQALSVAGGDLLASILIPLTPILIGIMEAAMLAMDGIKGFIGGLQSVFSGLPEWAQIAIGIAAVALAVGIAIAAFGGLQVVIPAVTGPLISLVGIIGAISWPVVAVVAAIGLLIAAIYEVGIAFGWWKDVGTMFEAISVNVGRLWNAFINHPDVKAIISDISNGLQVLGKWIGYASREILKFFGVSTGSKWDVTRAIIDGIGIAFGSMVGKIRLAISILKAVWGTLSWLVGVAVSTGQAIYNGLKPIICVLLGCSPGIVPALERTKAVFMSVWSAIAGFIGGAVGEVITALQPIIDILTIVVEFLVGQFMESWNAFIAIVTIVASSVAQLITIFQLFMDGQISLTTALAMVWNVISTMFATVLRIIIQRVISFGANLASLAISLASRFVNNIITFISQLPGRVATYLVNVASRITSVGATWVSNAKAKAKAIVDGVGSILSGTASRVASALSGVVDAIVKPFREAYDRAKKYWDDIVSLGGNIAFGGDVAYGGDEPITERLFTPSESIEERNTHEKLEIDITETLKLDLINVPGHIDEPTLIQMLESTNVLKAITQNRKFQELDNQIKSEIISKSRRASGV